tara:strand:- start:67733 stop:68341 length:609 start_codon:yes stop_codon:yes gene_type:complete
MQEAIKEDHFKTLKNTSLGDYREKGSKFFAIAFPATTVDEFKDQLQKIKKEYHDARHWCFAYRINPEQPEIRANDDGEPSNSAGMPIYNQIQSFELWNVGIIVVRYFGGTKLGVSGLVNAYKTAAHEALEDGKIETQFILKEIKIEFPYKLMNDISRLIKNENINIIDENMGIKGGYTLGFPKNDAQRIIKLIEVFHEIKIY